MLNLWGGLQCHISLVKQTQTLIREELNVTRKNIGVRMTNEERYKDYMLRGLLTSKELYMDEHPSVEVKETIAKTFMGQFNIEVDDYNDYRETYSDIPYIKSKFTKNREEGFSDIVTFYNWYKKQPQVCGYCGISQGELRELFTKDENKKLPLNGAKKRSSGTLEIERIDSSENEYNEKNCILACPLCNNAKSNLIDEDKWRELFVPGMRKYYESLLGRNLKNLKS